MKGKPEKIAEIICANVSYFNGWQVSSETMQKDCYNAAVHILAYLKRRSPRRRRAERKSK